MPRKNQGWITFQTSAEERQILEAYCQQTQRSKTEILRELVRSLATSSQAQEQTTEAALEGPEPPVVQPSRVDLGPIQVSARNLLQGRIIRLNQDGINTELTLEVAPGVELTSVITTTSAQRLQLRVGKVAYAMIKSSNVMILVSGSLEPVAESSLA